MQREAIYKSIKLLTQLASSKYRDSFERRVATVKRLGIFNKILAKYNYYIYNKELLIKIYCFKY